MSQSKETYIYEVKTWYKSGKTRTMFIEAETEEQMWKYYDSRCNAKLIESSAIVDCNLS